jgi:hypothetical protein
VLCGAGRAQSCLASARCLGAPRCTQGRTPTCGTCAPRGVGSRAAPSAAPSRLQGARLQASGSRVSGGRGCCCCCGGGGCASPGAHLKGR